MADKAPPKDTRTIVLLDDVDKVGKKDERHRVHPSQATSLVEKGKARWATKADFGL